MRRTIFILTSFLGLLFGTLWSRTDTPQKSKQLSSPKESSLEKNIDFLLDNNDIKTIKVAGPSADTTDDCILR
jgi:hypothetical protein